MPDQRGDRDHDGAAEDVGPLDRLQMQLLVHHRRDPPFAVGGDRVHDLLEQIPREPFGCVDVPDLPALRLGHGVDLGFLPLAFGPVVVALRDG